MTSSLQCLRSEGRELTWSLVLEDPNKNIELHLNSLPVDPKVRHTCEISSLSMNLSSDNDDMLDHFLWVGKDELPLESVNIKLTRLNSKSLLVDYVVYTEVQSIEKISGNLEVVDSGLLLLDKSRDNIEKLISSEYPDLEFDIVRGKTRWGIKAELNISP